MIRPVLLLTALCLLACPALGQDRPRAVRPPANFKEATVQRWLKANVRAGDFVFTAFDEEGAYYLEPALNQPPSRSMRRLWLRYERFAADANGGRSRRTLYEYDCTEQRSRMLAMDTFSGLNLDPPLKSGDLDLNDEVRWTYERPDSLGEELLRQACAMQHSRLSKPPPAAGDAP
jgi:hypothetical protein